jgi:hypothetical protein
MRTILIASALAIAFAGSASAQMCGGSAAQHQSTAQAGGMSGCMGMQRTQVEDDPMADKPAAAPGKPMMGGMMCPCCRNMASMTGAPPQGGGQPSSGEPHKH